MTNITAKDAYALSSYNSWSAKALREIQPLIKHACENGKFMVSVPRKGISDIEVNAFRVTMEALGYRFAIDPTEIIIKWDHVEDKR